MPDRPPTASRGTAGEGVSFSFSYPQDATPAEIRRLRDHAESEAMTNALNRPAAWRLNETECCPGQIIAVRLRDGRFMECEDGPEVLGLSWLKHGEPDDVVEYLPVRERETNG